MSHMQIDNINTHPAVQSLGDKRPRSPASPSPQDRPFKRVVLAPGSADRTPSPLLEHAIQKQQMLSVTNPQIQPSVLQERKASDDWVAKTGGLKLDSPLLGIGHEGFISLPQAGKWSCTESAEVGCVEDEPMITDIDDTTFTMRGSWPSSSNAEHTAPRPGIHHPHGSDAVSSPLYSTTPIHTISTTQSDIRVHVHSATPSHRGARRSSLTHSSPMSISPSNSGSWRPPTPSARRPRVSMGPRPDCEKCKNKVKGHWMHID